MLQGKINYESSKDNLEWEFVTYKKWKKDKCKKYNTAERAKKKSRVSENKHAKMQVGILWNVLWKVFVYNIISQKF